MARGQAGLRMVPTGRTVAAEVLVRVERDAAFAAAALEAELERAVQLDPRDRGLATELTYGTLRVTGNYHDFGAFATDVSKLSRIVTLNEVTLNTNKDSTLTMETVAKTYRYLDEAELAAQRKAAAGTGVYFGIAPSTPCT